MYYRCVICDLKYASASASVLVMNVKKPHTQDRDILFFDTKHNHIIWSNYFRCLYPPAIFYGSLNAIHTVRVSKTSGTGFTRPIISHTVAVL